MIKPDKELLSCPEIVLEYIHDLETLIRRRETWGRKVCKLIRELETFRLEKKDIT